jgi:hypothetical protein
VTIPAALQTHLLRENPRPEVTKKLQDLPRFR